MILEAWFKNCQSLEDVHYKFSTDVMNVIIGPNDTGKSIFFKMLKISACPTYFTSKDRGKLISWGKDYAEVSYALSNGCIVIVRVYSNRNIYFLKRVSDDKFTSYSEPPEELLDGLELVLDERSNFIVNIIDSDQDLLLVNSALRCNHSLIEMLLRNDTLTKLKERLENLSTIWLTKESILRTKLNFIQSRINRLSYVDVDKLEYDVKLEESVLETVYELVGITESIQIINNRIVEPLDYTSLFSMIESLSFIESSQYELQNIAYNEVFDNSLLDLLEILEDFEQIHASMAEMVYTEELDTSLLFMLEILLSLDIVNHSLMDLSFDKIDENELDLCDTLDRLEKCYYYIKNVNVVETIDYNEVGVLLDVFSDLESIYNSLVVMQGEVLYQMELKPAISELEVEMLNSGIPYDCPVHGKVVYDGKTCVPYNK